MREKKQSFREANHANESSVFTFVVVQLLSAGLHHLIIQPGPWVPRMELRKNLKVNFTYTDKF